MSVRREVLGIGGRDAVLLDYQSSTLLSDVFDLCDGVCWAYKCPWQKRSILYCVGRLSSECMPDTDWLQTAEASGCRHARQLNYQRLGSVGDTRAPLRNVHHFQLTTARVGLSPADPTDYPPYEYFSIYNEP